MTKQISCGLTCKYTFLILPKAHTLSDMPVTTFNTLSVLFVMPLILLANLSHK